MKYLRSRHARRAIAPAFFGAALMLSSEAKADNPLAPIWTGVYIGAQGGGSWQDVKTDFGSGFSTKGVSGGGHAGINWNTGVLVLGIEADASLENAEIGYSTLDNKTTINTDWSGTVRARVGVPFGPALIYATAGYAWSNMSISDNDGTTTLKGTHRFDGLVYGGGVETYVLPNLSLRVEALRFEYGADKFSLDGAASATKLDPSETVVRAGLTFHLN